jgi:hypothetical protein
MIVPRSLNATARHGCRAGAGRGRWARRQPARHVERVAIVLAAEHRAQPRLFPDHHRAVLEREHGPRDRQHPHSRDASTRPVQIIQLPEIQRVAHHAERPRHDQRALTRSTFACGRSCRCGARPRSAAARRPPRAHAGGNRPRPGRPRRSGTRPQPARAARAATIAGGMSRLRASRGAPGLFWGVNRSRCGAGCGADGDIA